MVTATKISGKNIHGRKSSPRSKVEHLFDVTLGIREHSFKSYK